MAIASQQETGYATSIAAADVSQKAAAVSSSLDKILAKVTAQRSQQSTTGAKPVETHRKPVQAAHSAPRESSGLPTPLAQPNRQLVFKRPAVAPPTVENVEDNVEPIVAVEGAELLNLQQMASEGHFQAIAYWLNAQLVNHDLYAQVLADKVPGRLKVLVEFERAPEPKRLSRFVCDRLYHLNSEIIEGVHLIVRPLGASKTDWEKIIRIPTATERAQKQSQTLQVASNRASTLLAHESKSSQLTRQAVKSQFNFVRAMLICGGAIAALFFGGFSELILSTRLSSVVVAPEDNIAPWFAEEMDDFSGATAISFRPASRFSGRTVEAALETVAVVPHRDVAEPANPTVTLVFGGELSLNDFVFEETSDIDRLFSDIDIYQQADVAMVGLAEPLANASTTLQEDFHHRTRPQAVQTLKAGGIDIISLADESTLKYGARGLAETLNNLDRQGLYRVGAGRNQQEAHRPEILEVKGQRIAYLGYNPDALKGAKGEKAGVALANSENRQHITEDIQAIRSQVDWIVVNYRWANSSESHTEHESDLQSLSEQKPASDPSQPDFTTTAPEDWQKSLAHEAVDAGADLVVGYHPDFVQGTEIYRDRPIAYSLGDFTFDSDPLQDHDTAALKVSLRNQQMKVEFLPVTIRDAKLQLATKEHGTAILQSIRSASKTLDQPLSFPTVIKAEPVYNQPTPTTPNITHPRPVEPSTEPFIESPIYDPPAPDPVTQESEALFIDGATEADKAEPWVEPFTEGSLDEEIFSNDDF